MEGISCPLMGWCFPLMVVWWDAFASVLYRYLVLNYDFFATW